MSWEKAKSRLVRNYCEYFKKIKFKIENEKLNQNFKFEKSLNLDLKIH
jgi:hypothetical protein